MHIWVKTVLIVGSMIAMSAREIFATPVNVELSITLGNTNVASGPMKRITKKIFHPIDRTITRDWENAAKYCEEKKWKLASIESDEENKQVLFLLGAAELDDNRYWISAHEPIVNKGFKWRYTDKPLLFTNWASGEPTRNYLGNDIYEKCVEIRDKTWDREWNDNDCDMKFQILCEETVELSQE